jgi:uncharacterized protein
MVYHRVLVQNIEQQLSKSRKVITILGPRQVGKTTLLNKLLDKTTLVYKRLNADLQSSIDVLSSRDLNKLKELVDGIELLVIDEAQNVPDIGMSLKILYDEIPELKIIVTGSSALELANKTKEALTGRTRTFYMYPMSLLELKKTYNTFDLRQQLESYLRYGMYPEVLTIQHVTDKKQHLLELTSSYLYKDILQLSNIRHSDKIHKLLKLLAFQIGQLVSVQEIAVTLKISHETVNDYIDLLEKGFIVKRLSGFNRNLRKEVSKMDKIYFYDLGVRNMLIENFNALDSRIDVGALWENFLFMERQKKTAYHAIAHTPYFWRTYSGAELDYVEERDGKLFGYEFKWNNKKARIPKTWLETYDTASFELINQDNYFDFVL